MNRTDYVICELCGASLDPGERCDCSKTYFDREEQREDNGDNKSLSETAQSKQIKAS